MSTRQPVKKLIVMRAVTATSGFAVLACVQQRLNDYLQSVTFEKILEFEELKKRENERLL